MASLNSFRELRVYQELRRLHLAVHVASLQFPKFEMFELGSQVRRSSNSAPAILAEGWGSRHTNIYIESINRTKGEVRETQHHLDMALAKGYLDQAKGAAFDAAYEVCDRMLEKLHQRLSEWRGTTRTGYDVHDPASPYLVCPKADDWTVVSTITHEVLNDFPQPSPPSSSPSSPSTLHLPPFTLHPPPLTKGTPLDDKVSSDRLGIQGHHAARAGHPVGAVLRPRGQRRARSAAGDGLGG